MNGFIKFALGIANMSSATVADLEKSLPGFTNIAAAFKEMEPIIAKAEPLIEQLQPLVLQAIPIVKRVWPDIVSVTPTIEELIAFANAKGGMMPTYGERKIGNGV